MPCPLFETSLNALEIAVFDLETTGLIPARDHIIQLAVVPVTNGVIEPAQSHFEAKVNPGEDVEIEQFILDLTGLNEAEIRAAPGLATQLREFDARVGSRIVAGHNIKSFDLPFVKRAERHVGIDVQTDYYIDTYRLAKRLKPGQERHRLKDSAAAYGLEFDEGELHDALADTRLCAELLLKQIEHLAELHVVTFGDMLDYLT